MPCRALHVLELSLCMAAGIYHAPAGVTLAVLIPPPSQAGGAELQAWSQLLSSYLSYFRPNPKEAYKHLGPQIPFKCSTAKPSKKPEPFVLVNQEAAVLKLCISFFATTSESGQPLLKTLQYATS